MYSLLPLRLGKSIIEKIRSRKETGLTLGYEEARIDVVFGGCVWDGWHNNEDVINAVLFRRRA